MLPSRLKSVSVCLVATLIVVAGCSILAPKTYANGLTLSLVSRQEAGVCSNLGTIVFGGRSFVLPNTVAVSFDQTYQITFNPAPGCSFVEWQKEGEALYIESPKSLTTMIHTDSGGTLRVVYTGTCCSVGGIMTPVNPLITLAPYLAVIALVATTAAVAVKKRKN